MNNKLEKFRFMLKIQSIVMLCFVIFMFIQYLKIPDLKIPITEWSSKYISYNVGWYVDESIVKVDEADVIDLLYGPYVRLNKGSYTVKVDYECDEDQGCLVYANSGNDKYINTEPEILKKDKNRVSYDFDLKRDIDNVEIVIKYNGVGFLNIKDIDIKKNGKWILTNLLILFWIFSLFDMVAFAWNTERKTIAFIACLLLLGLIAEQILAGAERTSWVEMEEIHRYPNSYDVCILGPSTAMINNSNQELYEQYGIASISLAGKAQALYVTRYALEEMLQYQRPQVVFLDTNPLFYSTERDIHWTQNVKHSLLYDYMNGIKTLSIRKKAYETMQTYVNFDQDYRMKLQNVHKNWKNIVNPDFIKIVDHGRVHGNEEFMGSGGTFVNVYDTSDPNKIEQISEENEKLLLEMINLCKEAEVDFILLTECVDFSKARHNTVENLADKYGVSYLDINEYVSKIGFSFEQDLYDRIHFNLSGAIKCSDLLGEYLSDHYVITDKRQDPDFGRYEDYIDAFSKKKSVLTGIPFNQYLKQIVDLDKKKYAVFLSVYDEATNYLQDEDIELLKKLGLDENLKEQYRCSYAAVISDNEIWEDFSAEDTVVLQGEIDGIEFEVKSGGFLSGKNGEIKIDGVDYMRKGRGFNIVIFNRESKLVEDSVYFDTFANKNPFSAEIIIDNMQENLNTW